MNRQVVAGLLGLAVAGCAFDRTGGSRPRGPLPPVGMTPPMPSIHEAINRDNPQVDPNSVRVGHPAEVSDRPGRSPETAPAPVAVMPPNVPATAPVATNPEARGSAPEVKAAPAGVPDPAPSPPPAADPAPAPAPEPAPPADAVTLPTADPASPASAPTPAGGRVPILLPGPVEGVPAAAPAVGTPSPSPLAAPPAVTTDPAAVRDPLLGSNPDVMPRMDVVPATQGAGPVEPPSPRA